MGDFFQDLGYSVRILRKNAGFTVVAALALALGIGACTAIFSVVNSVLLRPLPYEHPEQLVKVWGHFSRIGVPNDWNWVSAPEYVDIHDMNQSFEHVAAINGTSFNVTFGGTPERIDGATVSPGFFPLLGVQAQFGRVFRDEEGQPGRDNVALISNGLWKRRFASNPAVVGTTIPINSRGFVIVGVLPEGFSYPADVEMWAPLSFSADDLSPNNRGSHGLEVIARVKPALTLEQARSDMKMVTQRIIDQNPDYDYRRARFYVVLNPLLEETVGDIRKALWILMGAVGFVLLIACANVANLLLVRASAREKEIAIRTALGAGRFRLIRQMLTESALLGVLGGVAGLLLAHWGLKALITLSAASFPRVGSTKIDIAVLAFTIAVAIGTGILFGLAPALAASRGVTQKVWRTHA
jgi:predicted permease